MGRYILVDSATGEEVSCTSPDAMVARWLENTLANREAERERIRKIEEEQSRLRAVDAEVDRIIASINARI